MNNGSEVSCLWVAVRGNKGVDGTKEIAFFRHKDFPYSVEDELKRQMEIEHREGLDFFNQPAFTAW